MRTDPNYVKNYNTQYYLINKEKITAWNIKYRLEHRVERAQKTAESRKRYNLRMRKEDLGLRPTWWGILTRCNSKGCNIYKHYGGRGIKCLWGSYESFKNDMYKSYVEHLEIHGRRQTTIDRIDVNGDYCKDNCKWSTMKEQAQNKRPYKRNKNRKGVKYKKKLSTLL